MTAPLLAITAAAAALVMAYLYYGKCVANEALQAQNATLLEQNKKLLKHLPQSMAA